MIAKVFEQIANCAVAAVCFFVIIISLLVIAVISPFIVIGIMCLFVIDVAGKIMCSALGINKNIEDELTLDVYLHNNDDE